MKSLFKILAVLILIFIVFLLIKRHLHTAEFPQLPSYIEGEGTVHVLAVDLNADADLSYTSFLKSDDSIMALHNSNSTDDHSSDVVDEKFLTSLDTNHDAVIDANDPIFSRLELLTITKDKDGSRKLKFIPLRDAGVRAIYLENKYLDASAKKTFEYSHIVASVVLADGSKRLVRDIVIDKSKIEK